MKKIISPIVYMLSTIPVFFLALFSVSFMEFKGMSHTIWRTGDVDIFLFTLFWGIIVFGLTTYFILHFEEVKQPTIMTHAHHTTLVLFFFSFGLIIYIHNATYSTGSLQAALSTVILGIMFMAIIVNAVMIYLKSRNY